MRKSNFKIFNFKDARGLLSKVNVHKLIVRSTFVAYPRHRQLLLYLMHAVHGRLNVNVALNRPAFMSSVYSTTPAYGGVFSPSKAVDGNKDPAAIKLDNSCVGTLIEDNPWWAVDLGAAVAVDGVLFTNRADVCEGSGCGNVLCLLNCRHCKIRLSSVCHISYD